MEHWAVGVLHITKHTIHCDFYDSAPPMIGAKQVEGRLKAWLEESGSSHTITFANKVSFQYPFVTY
jgi:hypothetical protein